MILFFALLTPTMVFAQKVEKDIIDKFSKARVIETSSEKIADYNKWKSLFPDISDVKVCIRYVGGKWSMPATLCTDEVVKYTEDDGIMLLLENDEIVDLKTIYTGLSSGNIRKEFTTVFRLTDEDRELLRKNKIVSVRLSYLGGYKDFDVTKKRQDKIIKMFYIIEKKLRRDSL